MTNLYLKQKVFAIRDKLTFYDELQQPVYLVKGSIFHIPHRLEIRDASGQDVVQVKTKLFSLMKTFNIIDLLTGQQIGMVRRCFSFNKNFNVEIGGEEMRIKGSLFGFEFAVENQQGEKIISVSKKWVSWGDTYQISIDEEKIKPEIAAAICVAFDNAIHNNKNKH